MHIRHKQSLRPSYQVSVIAIDDRACRYIAISLFAKFPCWKHETARCSTWFSSSIFMAALLRLFVLRFLKTKCFYPDFKAALLQLY
jgi:hypothetical protein